MTEQAASFVWLSLAAYMAVGFVAAFLVLIFGLGKLESGAAKMPLHVRALITPGLMALWPLILARLSGQRAREDKR